MILAAGLGTRLGEMTKKTPKCLMEVGGKPILEHLLKKFSDANIVDIAINVFYLGDQIKNFLKDKNNFGLNIYLSQESTLLGTGGGIKNVRPFLENDENFLVHNADVYSDVNFLEMFDFHKKNDSLVSLGVMQRETTRPLLFDKNERLCGWENTEKGIGEVFGNDSDPQKLAFSGIQIISNRIFKYMEDETSEFSSIRVFIKAAKKGEKVSAFLMNKAYWIDIGTPEKLSELRTILTPKGELN